MRAVDEGYSLVALQSTFRCKFTQNFKAIFLFLALVRIGQQTVSSLFKYTPKITSLSLANADIRLYSKDSKGSSRGTSVLEVSSLNRFRLPLIPFWGSSTFNFLLKWIKGSVTIKYAMLRRWGSETKEFWFVYWVDKIIWSHQKTDAERLPFFRAIPLWYEGQTVKTSAFELNHALRFSISPYVLKFLGYVLISLFYGKNFHSVFCCCCCCCCCCFLFCFRTECSSLTWS